MIQTDGRPTIAWSDVPATHTRGSSPGEVRPAATTNPVERFLVSDRTPDSVAALAVLAPIATSIFVAIWAISRVAA